MNKLTSVFNEILHSNEYDSTEKLHRLNNNSYLNGFLVNKNYNLIIELFSTNLKF